ncbi:MAG TPA: phosphatidylglycerophosphatase A [Polyangiaceae bacterium]|nr:phosphatidylglycerophosphatase A [Polyangiaceae bacterium]
MTVHRTLAWILATWFGCGRAPVAPGTVGTLGALPLYLAALAGGRAGVVAAALGATLVGVWAAGVVARDLGAKDPQVVVIDEVAGMLVTLIPIARASALSVATGFVLFRVLDATKPGPIRWLERLPRGWGIVLDDVGAGAIAAVVLAAMRVGGLLP